MKVNTALAVSALVALSSARAAPQEQPVVSNRVVVTSIEVTSTIAETMAPTPAPMTTAMTTMETPAVVAPVVPTALQMCLDRCAPEDVNCRAACGTVPSPNYDQVVATNECSARCSQGNGSAEDAQAFAACQETCVQSYYLASASMAMTSVSGAVSSVLSSASSVVSSVEEDASSVVSSAMSGASSLASSASAGVSSRVASASSAVSSLASRASSATSAAGAAATGNAAGHMQVGASFAGVVGIIAAAIAL